MTTFTKVSLLGAVLAVGALAGIGGMTLLRMKQNDAPAITFRTEMPMVEAQQTPGVSVPDFRAAAKKILPSVVTVTTMVQGQNWFGEQYIEPAGTGSGVVLSKNGYIVTNNHVVTMGGRRKADQVMVKFADGKSVVAKIIGLDPRADLAVLKVERNDLTPIVVGDSASIEPGSWAIAAGNPLGFEQTISVGVISSLGRPLKSQDYAVFVDGIQTDAAINQGNSGGALCDVQGKLIGINTMIASTDQGSVGIGFAIPVNRVKSVVDDIIKYGHARYGRFGVAVMRDSSVLSMKSAREELVSLTGATSEPPTKGVLVQQVYEGGPAALAGLKRLDVITSINGKPMNETMDYQVFMAGRKPGEVLTLSVWSAGQTKTLKVTLDEATSN